MQYTNNLNLPEVLVRAIAYRDSAYNKDADYSITQLLSPPQQVQLLQRHADEISVDVSDLIFALRGSAIHGVIELGAGPNDLCEERLHVEMAGKTISGMIDFYEGDTETLWDWKEMSVWEVIFGIKPERIQQLNCYRGILYANGFHVEALKLGIILRDWKKTEADRKSDYPQQQVVIVGVPMWTLDEAADFLEDRIRLHEVAAEMPSARLPECTAEERWHAPDVWAVMKEGRKTAVKLHDNEQDAIDHMESAVNLYIQFRPGEDKRCALYCNAAPFCHQYQSRFRKS